MERTEKNEAVDGLKSDLAKAARRIVDSKSFDNSILCTNESTVLAKRASAPRELTMSCLRWLSSPSTLSRRDLARLLDLGPLSTPRPSS